MNTAVATVNLMLGLAYCGIGVMTAIDMRRDWKSFGVTQFGLAFLCIAFTCGPHHLVHGIHIALEGRSAGPLDLFTVVVGLPAGVIWLGLRVEAFVGGRGDRFLRGTPWWLGALPPLATVYLAVLVAASLGIGGGVEVGTLAATNVVLVAIYIAIGWFLLRTQLRNRGPLGGWSVSGLSLSAVFATCAPMHGIWAIYNIRGQYLSEVHGLVIDWLSIPAGLYFLWVVHKLYRDTLRDWNHGIDDIHAPSLEEPVLA